jgi:hypothetical protein
VNPLAFATRGNHPRATQVGKMPRDFRLIYLQNLHKETHTDLVVTDEIYESQTGVIRKRFEEKCDVVFFVPHAVFLVALVIHLLRFLELQSSFFRH